MQQQSLILVCHPNQCMVSIVACLPDNRHSLLIPSIMWTRLERLNVDILKFPFDPFLF